MNKHHNGSTYQINHYRFERTDKSGKWSPIYDEIESKRLEIMDYLIIGAACFVLAFLIIKGF